MVLGKDLRHAEKQEERKQKRTISAVGGLLDEDSISVLELVFQSKFAGRLDMLHANLEHHSWTTDELSTKSALNKALPFLKRKQGSVVCREG